MVRNLVAVIVVLVIGVFLFSRNSKNTTVTNLISPTPGITALPTPSAEDITIVSVSISDLVKNPSVYKGKRIRVSGRVVYDMLCPPNKGVSCQAVAYLVDASMTGIASYQTSQGINLAEGARRINCIAQNTKPQNCNGWIDQHIYEVTGTVDHERSGNRDLPNFILEVNSKTAL